MTSINNFVILSFSQNSSSQLMKKVAVAPVNNLTQTGTTVATTAPGASSGQVSGVCACVCTSCFLTTVQVFLARYLSV